MNAEEETRKHIGIVKHFLFEIIEKLKERADNHDYSKLESPESEAFEEFTPKLRGTTYGTEEYQKLLDQLKPALEHHYANNPHHPEYWEGGVNDMTIVDIVELLCDWKSATLRHADGDIMKSIDINEERFGLSPQLAGILRNSVRSFGWDNREIPEGH